VFTKRRFIKFPTEQQHKKCAELLKIIYENLLSQNPTTELENHYNEIQEWMNLPTATLDQTKLVADRYHFHLNLAKRQLKEHNLLPQVRHHDKIQAEPLWPIAIYLDQLRSAHNVGSIIRTVEAFSLGTLHFSPDTPYITHKQVQDAAMGTHAWVKCTQEEGIDKLPRPMIVMETTDHAIPLTEFVFPEQFTLVVGNEEYGCSDTTLKNADYIVQIPLRGRKNSLNVANAFAIAAAEILRQKGRK